MTPSNTLLTLLADVTVAFEAPTVAAVSALGEPELLGLQRTLAEVRRRVDTASAAVAAEVARRSHFSLGHDGLAQRLGARTPQALVQRLTGSTAREAAALVRVGALLAADSGLSSMETPTDEAPGGPEVTSAPPRECVTAPWLTDVVAAVASTQLSVEAADAIRAGLGEPDAIRAGLGEPDELAAVESISADTRPSDRAGDGASDDEGGFGQDGAVTVELLREAARQLLIDATTCTIEQLAVRARHARALLDAEADASRTLKYEQVLRDRRYLYLSRQPDGMTRLSGLLDPESAALVTAAIDSATSPRRGGPRFISAAAIDGAKIHGAEVDGADVDGAETDRAERLVRDERSIEQLAADTLVELVRLGGEIAPTHVVGVRSPSVQVIVAARDLAAHHGLARIEGQTEPISIATAEKHICASGTVTIAIDDDGDVLTLGRETRLYSRRQRIALAVRDGGCRFPECTRPPSWAEAHHITPWSEGGRTDVHDGVLLCRHHHLLLNNNGWKFTRVNNQLAVVPPQSLDPSQTPIPAPSKNPLIDRVRARRA
jgi:hypothetical protein